MNHSSLVCLSLVIILGGISPLYADWPRFRGPNGSGISLDQNVPTQWSDQENLRWKTALPGPGFSSPIISGDRVFVTCYSGYGADRNNPGTMENLARHLVCLEREDGKILWTRTIKAALPEDPFGGYLREHGYASNTPVTDGTRVYTFFGKSGLFVFDFQGKQLWQADLGQESSKKRWGSAASPILYKNMVIVNASEESQSIRAFDKHSGKELWKAQASALELAYNTPLLVETKNGQTDLLLAVPEEIWGLNPDTGKLKWHAETRIPGNICPSVATQDGIVYAFGGYPRRGSAAVRLGGKGDVTKTHLIWTGRKSPYVPSPVLYQNHFYWVDRQGIACCLSAKDGSTVYQERLVSRGGAARFYSSPILIGEKLYVVSRNRGTFLLAAQPEFKQLAQNQFESDQSDFSASPAVDNGRLYLRSNRFIYCIGAK